MRRFVFCGTLLLLVLVSLHASAQDPRAAGNPQTPRHDHRHDHGHWHRGQTVWWFDIGCPLTIGGGPFPVFAPYYPPYAYSYFGYSIVLPPVATPVIVIQPPPAPAAPAAVVPAAAAKPQAGGDPPADPPARVKVRSTNAEQKAKAGRFIAFGDGNFARQKYHSAVERYKTAIEIAPDVAESYFRQAFALVAMGRYEQAAVAFRRGLQVRSDWTASPMRLDQLYADAPLPKTHHIESLAKAVEANAFDADLHVVLGMVLFFDGQRDRAGVFFVRAGQLGGNEDQLLSGFLPPAQGAAAGDPQPPPGKIVF